MLVANRIAFKEWSVVCAALEAGRQSLILRKGGIHEGRDGFRVQHDQFWLFPTGFHQQPRDLIPDAWPLHQATSGIADRVVVNLYAVVHDVQHVTDRSRLANLAGQHIWSEETVSQRFDYRTPGLFVLTVRVYRLDESFVVSVTPAMAGCKSWVELPDSLPTDQLQPVVLDAEFDRQRGRIATAMGRIE